MTEATEESNIPSEDEDPFNTCIAHPVASEDDCELCSEEMLRRQTVLEQLMQDNTVRLDKLAKVGIRIDPMSLLGMRMDVFIQMVLPEIRHRFMFEMRFHQEMQKVVENMEKESAKARLTMGVPNLGGNMQPNRAQRRGRG